MYICKMPEEGGGEVLRAATQNAALVLQSVMSGETFLTRDLLVQVRCAQKTDPALATEDIR